MVLRPLEFRDCLSDSPWFRQCLHEHELALERSYKAIKNLELQCRELISAAQKLSRAQRNFAVSLKAFKFEGIGNTQTDEEKVIANCLKEFGGFISQVEDERDRILDESEKNYVEPLRSFRVNRIASALQDEKKKFEKASGRFYSSLDKHLHLSTHRKNNDFKEADASLEMEQRAFYQASLDYVFVLQSVQERMKFEFVETLSSFLYSWLNFYHVGHLIHEDFKPYLDDVQTKVQKARDNFNATQPEVAELKAKMLHVRSQNATVDQNGIKSTVKQGYLYLLEKKNLINSWTKYFCVYQKETGMFTMIPFSQTSTKPDMKAIFAQTTSVKLTSCTRRASDSIDKRFCFDITVDKGSETLTLQALSEEDRRQWMDAMDGKEPVYSPSASSNPTFPVDAELNAIGISFLRRCLDTIERQHGLDEQGLYRNCGVNSKVQKLLQIGLDETKCQKLDLTDEKEWELRTITSAVKTYLRNLPEPLLTYELHNKFINAAKIEDKVERVHHVHYLVHQLPRSNFQILEIIISHLKKVADNSPTNLMTMANLGVCFGPTLLRPQEETLAAIMDIKFCNVVVEVLIRNCEKIFSTLPQGASVPRPPKPAHTNNNVASTSNGDSSPVISERSNNSEPSSRRVHSVSVASSSVSNPIYAAAGIRTRPLGIYCSSGESGVEPAAVVDRQDDCRSGDIRELPHKSSSSCDSLNSINSQTTTTAVSNLNSGAPSPNSSLTSIPKMNVSYAQPYTSDLIHKRLSGDHYNLASSRRVRTLYECLAGHETELSFQPGQIITNVYESKEPGWLVGTLNGKTGLIPENYIEPLP